MAKWRPFFDPLGIFCGMTSSTGPSLDPPQGTQIVTFIRFWEPMANGTKITLNQVLSVYDEVHCTQNVRTGGPWLFFANKKKTRRKTLLLFSLVVRKYPDNVRTTFGHLSPKCPNDVLSMSAQIASPKLIASPSTPWMHHLNIIHCCLFIQLAHVLSPSHCNFCVEHDS